mmetsp:Transcript_45479/g.141306  ORF Transcript_45479/g.141306 Transcript_45479/m.141306 type:complete len:226 (-) Transcript_45479:600-1277(-)
MPAPYIRSKFSTYSRVSESSWPAPALASKDAPRVARATSSATAGISLSRASSWCPCSSMAFLRFWMISSTILGPPTFFFLPSKMTEATMASQCVWTSAGCDANAAWACSTSSALSPAPLSCLLKAASGSMSSSGVFPATMRSATLPGARSVATVKPKRAASAGSSPEGASMSPAFASSSISFAACFCAPRPSVPARMSSRNFSTAGMIVFWTFGAPPAFFHAPLA